MNATAMLAPLFALALWTCVMALWMLFMRIPTMQRMKIDPQRAQDTSKLADILPPEIMRVSNNYNHLFEQPTLFYAVSLAIAVAGITDAFFVNCAWAFVALRIVHSLVQATVDVVMLRFTVFLLSWAVLASLIVRGALAVF